MTITVPAPQSIGPPGQKQRGQKLAHASKTGIARSAGAGSKGNRKRMRKGKGKGGSNPFSEVTAAKNIAG